MSETAPPETNHPDGPEHDAGDADRDWQSAYQQEVAQSRKYRHRAQQAEQQLQQLQQDSLSAEQIRQYQQLRNQAEQFESAQGRIGRLTESVQALAGRDALVRSLVACGVGRNLPHGEKMLAQAVDLLQPKIRVTVDDGGPHVSIATDREDAEAVSLDAFVADWLASEAPHFLPPSGDTGSGAHLNPGSRETTSLAELDANPARKAKFIAENGPQAYVQLARQRNG
ncbi:MAG: hypothetical protein ACLFUJ_02935 [Phycisphaerae bacterium]